MPKPHLAHLSPQQRQLFNRAARPDLQRWLAHTAATRGCVRPVRLTGTLHTVEHATGRLVASRHTTELPDGVLYVPCGDRRASVCPPCAETYRADTYQLIKAGLVGGKGVPASVAGHPAVFATFTAPSFGPVHTRVVNPRSGKVQPCRVRRTIARCPHGKILICTQRHSENSPSLGRPLCLDCYDHALHVVWNGWAGELWRRTMISLGRSLRALERRHGVKLRISYGKVAEYQRRGVVHFHALIRLDRVDLADPDAVLAPPADITVADLADLIVDAATRTTFRTPDYANTGHSWPIAWGSQLDIRPLGLAGDEITAEAVAAYLAKYATKATEPTGLPVTARMTAEAAEHYSDPDTHHGRLIAYAHQLGTRPADWMSDQQKQDWHDTWGRLRRWTHMIGDDDHHGDHDTTLVVCDLTLAGIGWNTTADAQLAASAAARAREQRALAREERTTA